MARRPEDLTVDDLEAMIGRFAPAPLAVDLEPLSAGDMAALPKLAAATRLMDDIFLHQVWEGNPGLLVSLRRDKSALGRARLRYFNLNKGPWSRIDDNRPFVPGVPDPKPARADFYPEDLTKEEFSNWLAVLTPEERERAVGFYHTIRRGPDGNLRPVPYSEEYAPFLRSAADFLCEAASLTEDPSLATFLRLRAEAFRTNDYFESELAWLDLNAPLDVTIGPYETYEDGLFGYKAAFEAYVGVVDREGSARLARYAERLQEIEDALPLDPSFRNPAVSTVAPMQLVDLILAGGEGSSGVQTAAFNLPNDERVAAARGYKRVMFKNVQAAKFESVLVPISRRLVASGQQASVAFDAFFLHILLHELAHGLGPQTARLGGRVVPMRESLRELYSPIEEAKADVVSLFAAALLMERGHIPREDEASIYTTYLASAFRSVRFGIGEAHGRGVALQFNYLSDEGAISHDQGTGRFAVDISRARSAIERLAAELLSIQADGAFDRAQALLDRYAVLRPEMAAGLARLSDVPVDIAPEFAL